MPVATVDPSSYDKYELTTAPPDGYVMLRPLPYGEKVKRRDKQTKMHMRAQNPQGGGRGRMSKGSGDVVMEFETANEWALQFDFAYCIGEHNLTDHKGVLLDFTKPMAFKLLDPRVGTEIENLIDALNELEDEEALEDFHKQSSTSSEDVPTLVEGSGDNSPKIEAPVS